MVFRSCYAQLHACARHKHKRAHTSHRNTQESVKELKPERVAAGTMAFMFESYMSMKATAWALSCGKLQPNYFEAWQGLTSHFAPPGDHGADTSRAKRKAAEH
jgi:homogentisate 1,2-dioxygenase